MIANLIALPAFAGLAVTSAGIIVVIFSPIWIPAAPLMAILSLAALVMPTNYILAAATNALGRPDVAFKLSGAMLVLRIAACLIAVQFGVTAVAIANVVVSMLALPIFLFAINDLFKGRWLRLFRRVWVPAVASSFMAVVVLLMQPLLQNTDRVVALACQVLVGVAAYAVAVWFMAAPLEARSLAQMAFKRSPNRSI